LIFAVQGVDLLFIRAGIDTDELEFNTRKLEMENDDDYKKLLLDYNQKMESLSKSQ